MSTSLPDVPAAPRRKSRLRLLFTILALLVLLIVLAPYAAAGFVRGRIDRELSQQLGTPCRIEKLALGWFSGFDLRGLEIGNAPGFDRSHPLLRIAGARADVSLLRMLSGHFDVFASIDGLQLWIDENEAGETNLERTLAAAGLEVHEEAAEPAPQKPKARPTPRRPGRSRDHVAVDPDLIRRLRLDLSLRNGSIEIRRDGELLESVTGLDCTLGKEFESGRVRAALDATLPALNDDARPGAVHFAIDAEANTQAASGKLRAARFDLARYQPLLVGLLADGDLTALAGVVDGEVAFTYDPRGNPSLQTSGELKVSEPHVAGALVGGIDLHAEQWTLRPQVAVATTQRGATAVSAAGAHVDLGFLQLDGVGNGAAATFTLDLGALQELGGPFADAGSFGGQVKGTVRVDDRLFAGSGDAAFAALRRWRGIAIDAQLQDASCAAAGLTVDGGGAVLTLRDGKLAVATAPATTLNAGPFELHLAADGSDTAPFELTVQWRGGKVEGDAARALRWLVPVLAGLPDEPSAFGSQVDLSMTLRGPARRPDGDNWLQWLDRFEGNGQFELRDGSLAPAPALRPLLDLLGQQERLSIERFAGGFSMQRGTIAMKAARWLSKGKEYGLTGNVHLDGRLDFGIDVTAILEQHKDGKVVAAFLKNQPLVAGLGGTLDAPKLAAPDLAAMVEAALKQAPRQLLEQQGLDLLRREIERLGGKKKQ